MSLSPAEALEREVARRQVSLSFLMSVIVEPTPPHQVRVQVMRIFTQYWSRQLPYAKLEEQLVAAGLPAQFMENGLGLYLNEEDIN